MTRIIAVTSGKGGVGKTHLSVNLALQCARKGLRTCLFDADLGLANVSLLFNLHPQRTLSDVISGACDLQDIVVRTCGIDVIPGSSGVSGMADLAPAALERLGAGFSALAQYDLVIFDTSSGVANNVMAFVAAAPEVVLVITPEPTALTDAYALVKVLQRQRYTGRLQVVVNQAVSERQARHTYEKFREVVRVYQGLELPLLGAVPADPSVTDAVRAQKPLSLLGPQSAAAVAFIELADRLIETAPAAAGEANALSAFWSRLTGTELPEPVSVPQPDAGSARLTEGIAADVATLPQVIAERLARLEAGLATVVQELLSIREQSPHAEQRRPQTAAMVKKPEIERRGNRRGPGETAAPARVVRNAQRSTPIDALQLRRVVGRMLVKAIPVVEADAKEPLRVAVDQIQLEAGNDFSLRPGRYTRVSLHCHHIESPDNFIEEIFANCAISGCKVRHLGSHVRYWVTSGRDGCILLDGDDNDRNCVQVYMAAGGNNLLDEDAAADESAAVPTLRRLPDTHEPGAMPALLLAKFPHQRVQCADGGSADLELFRLLRRDRQPLLCAFHSAGDDASAGARREPSPERAF